MKTQILFVDDEPRVLDGLRRSMRPWREQWEMHFAGGGEQALELMAREPIDVLVTDMCMPEMDGAELLRRVRHRYPGTVRIVLSGQFSKQAGLKAVAVAHQFLPKPSEPIVLHAAVEHSLAVRAIVTVDEIRRAAGAVGALPFRPQTHTALVKALDQADVSMEAIAEVIERDAAVTAKILQVVNSAFLGLSHYVASILSAVQLLGIDNLKQIVLSAEILTSFRPPRSFTEFSVEALHAHSQAAAQVAAKLPVPPELATQAVMAALLHDIGKLVIACQMPERMERIANAIRSGRLASPDAETEILGANHAEIGGYLLGLWGLPQPIVEAVLRHHRPLSDASAGWTIAEAVVVANALAREAEERALGQALTFRPELERSRLETLGSAHLLGSWREEASRIFDRLHRAVPQ